MVLKSMYLGLISFQHGDDRHPSWHQRNSHQLRTKLFRQALRMTCFYDKLVVVVSLW
jgi:hypothetical protein